MKRLSLELVSKLGFGVPFRGEYWVLKPVLVAAACLWLATDSARADGLFCKLPEDGTWATYHFVSSPMNTDGQLRLKGTVRIASVGRVTEKGQACRWIEVKWEQHAVYEDGRETPDIADCKAVRKLLIPEKFLVRGNSPLEHVIRTWKWAGASTEKVADPKEPIPGTFFQLGLLMAGPPTKAKQLDKAEVDSKLGKLPCEGVSETLAMKGSGTSKAELKVERRLHAKAPFGVVSTRLLFSDPNNPLEQFRTIEYNLKLIDFGTKAATELPDAK
jgi:hypothetical protein